MIEKVNVVTRHVLIVPDVEFVMTHRDTAIKARFLALPSRVARLLVGKTDFQEIFALLTEEVTAALEEIRAYDPHAFNELNEKYLATLFPVVGIVWCERSQLAVLIGRRIFDMGAAVG